MPQMPVQRSGAYPLAFFHLSHIRRLESIQFRLWTRFEQIQLSLIKPGRMPGRKPERLFIAFAVGSLAYPSPIALYRKEQEIFMNSLLLLVVVFAGWIVLNRWILPKLGINT